MKNQSLEARRKPNSHTKLPKIPSESIDSSLNRISNECGEVDKMRSEKKIQNSKSASGTSKSEIGLRRTPTQMKLSPIQSSAMSKI